MSNVNELLGQDLDQAVVKTRSQAGTTLSYVEGWYVIDEANKCFGYDGWSLETLSMDKVQEEQYTNKDGKELWRVGYSCRVRISIMGVIRDGFGFGQGIDRDLGQAHESAVKEAETDAMKRAFRTCGYRFGLALYDKTKSNVSKKSAGATVGDKKSAVDATAQKAWKAIGCDPKDYNSFLEQHGRDKALAYIAKAHKGAMTLDEAVKSSG